MVICPECGAPKKDDSLIVSESELIKCQFCGWSGERKELLLLTSGDLAEHPQLVERLHVLMEFMARKIGPQVGIKLVKLGLVPMDREYAPLLAELTRDSMQAAYKSVVTGLFPAEEKDVSGTG